MKKSLFFLIALGFCECNAAPAGGIINSGILYLLNGDFTDFTNTQSGHIQARDALFASKFLNEGTIAVDTVLTIKEKCPEFISSGKLQVKELKFESDKTVIKLSPNVLVDALYKGNNNLGSICFSLQNDGKAFLMHTAETQKTFVREVPVLEKILNEGLREAKSADELSEYLEKHTK